MTRSALKLTTALLGAIVYAAAGALMGSQNAGWFGLERDANALLPTLGVGAALVVVAFASSTLHMRLREAGRLGRATQVLLVVGPLLYILSWLIQFAIFGTLCLGIGLVCLAVAVSREAGARHRTCPHHLVRRWKPYVEHRDGLGLPAGRSWSNLDDPFDSPSVIPDE